MRSIILLFWIFSLSFQAIAQQPRGGGQMPKIGEVFGKIIDQQTNEPVGYATITIKKVDDESIVTGGLSDDQGVFSVTEIPFGEYNVEISFIGYDKTILGPISIAKDEYKVDLETVVLGIDDSVIEEVVIEAEGAPVRYEVDKKVYDATKIKAAEGGTAKDVLEQIPSITITSDQNLQLRGSENVRILVNGRPSNFDMNTLLEQVPQKNIKDIEIITNPSAKYDAEGEVGIINIILKENNLQGFTGGVNGSWGTENKWNGGANVAYRINKWNLSTSYNYNRFKDNFYRDNFRILKSSPSESQISDEDRDFIRARHFARLGVDYYLDDANTIFLSGSINKGDNTNDTRVISQNLYTELFTGTGTIPLDFYDYTRFKTEDGERNGYDVSASFQHIFGGNQSHNILFDVSRSSGTNNELNNYTINELINSSGGVVAGFNDSDSRERDSENTRFSIDYTNPFNGKQKLELGYRSTLEDRKELFNVYYNDELFSPSTGEFDFEQDVHAGYITYQNQLNDKVGVKGGIRAEYSDVKSIAIGGQNVSYEDDYLSLFPTASASLKANDNLQFTTSYSRRIGRPRGRQLNPFADRTDQNNVFVGNNGLRPQFTDSYELGFNNFGEVVSLDGAVYHRNVKDQIQYKNTYNVEQNLNQVSFFNLTQQKVYGAETSFDIAPKGLNWYSVRLSGNYNYSKVEQNDSDVVLENNEYSLFSGNIMNNFNFKDGLSGQLTARYQSPFQNYLGELNAMYSINASISKRILDNKGSIFLRANDIFNTQGLDIDWDNEIRTQSMELDWPSQMAFIGFNYSFGNLKQPARRKLERKEEQGDDSEPNIGL